MATQRVPGFLAKVLQGSIITERAQFRVLDPKSGKRYNVKIKEKRPKWYQLCFNCLLRKLHFKKRNHISFNTLGETDSEPLRPTHETFTHENLTDISATADQLTTDSADGSINDNHTPTDQNQRGETEVVVHPTPDARDSDGQYYNVPRSSHQKGETSDIDQEYNYEAVEISDIKAGNDGSSDVTPSPQPREEKAEKSTTVETNLRHDVVNEIVVYTPDGEDLSGNTDDYYEHKISKRYQQLICLPCNPESEIGELNLPSRCIQAD
ncbi:uncharacterized protein LOC119735376 [Patiria miniata]|uniref:Uncharacterized protein n=1 Tax=Patiria miniata TaxID=46514 RepID=A0A914AMN8_PATMI|nr:uncharacterized protein LOC119735376 [Patiria miniata]